MWLLTRRRRKATGLAARSGEEGCEDVLKLDCLAKGGLRLEGGGVAGRGGLMSRLLVLALM